MKTTKKKKFKFKLGQKTKDVWSGDLVSECVFLTDIGNKDMLFWDITFRCFRRVRIYKSSSGKKYMSGWDCASEPSELL
jgi:hypothetical protein